ncbi:PTS sugar transporter subunit IIA [Marinilactibacillus psychrotolerans]|uniref:PTS sugar transporter subunit IIA n=1 Tax=Marinilactibacillus psychrotolerans TaxID=191770 RepID=A0A5R9C7Z5_9LACT|nr:PTS sugar transporter subunit IIA [Marinilactibacillus psychrotolerans]TLQ09453.1 PTS sugar transporter subunit IIA [Marinilactibacillus psychrotolerans]
MKTLLVSHGDMAKGLINSYEMIAGKNNHLDSICLTNEGIDIFSKRLIEKLGTYKNEKVLILCDVKGGSPFNEAYKYQMMYPDDISIVCGMNLPMLIEVAFLLSSSDNLDVLYKTALEVGKKAIEGIQKEDEQESEKNELEF